MYECYNKYGHYVGTAYTKNDAESMIDYANFMEKKTVYSEWLNAKIYDPDISFEEYELQYIDRVKAQIKEAKMKQGKMIIKWMIIIFIAFMIYVYFNDNLI